MVDDHTTIAVTYVVLEKFFQSQKDIPVVEAVFTIMELTYVVMELLWSKEKIPTAVVINLF